MILLHSTDIEKTRANIHINDRDNCQNSKNNQSVNGKDLNAKGK